MVRARRVESESSELLALTAVLTAISAVHRKDARALFRFRKSAAAGQHDLLAIVKMPAAFGPTRPRSRATSRGRPIRTCVGTRRPAWQPLPINWCHGLTDEGENLPLAQISRNFIGNLTPRRKSDPFRETIQTLPPRLTLDLPLGTPQNVEMPLRASENLRFRVQKSRNH